MKVPTAERLRDLAAGVAHRAGRPARPARGSRVFDAVLALFLTLVSLRYAATAGAPLPVDWAGPALLLPFCSVPLAFRRRWPLAVLWVVLAATPFTRHVSVDVAFWAGVVCIVATYSAAAYGPHRVPTLASMPVAAAVLVVLFTDAKLPHFPNGIVALLALVPVLAAAWEIRMWGRRVEEGRARMSALEREQVEALDRAVEHERARIARELHDIVTHSVSVMVIQAGAARKIMNADPERAREALLAVEAGGRAAMTELRQVMGLLTIDADDLESAAMAELAPQPGLGRLEALLGGVRQSGMPVELTVSGEARPVPPGVELAAYRVVQEALTNTVKHASGARADVILAYAADHVCVEVTDSGGRPSDSASTGGGHGLIGLRERLAVHGGTLESGPRLRGGYRVKALIPLDAS
ncbi:sensor histidine kinase [Kitasatospora paranensis]|uniref:histidine kinase n=1 Tax=Kitasatospora paranensis TaxID=258053 RepID=A0ABW2FW77_9ACTN